MTFLVKIHQTMTEKNKLNNNKNTLNKSSINTDGDAHIGDRKTTNIYLNIGGGIVIIIALITLISIPINLSFTDTPKDNPSDTSAITIENPIIESAKESTQEKEPKIVPLIISEKKPPVKKIPKPITIAPTPTKMEGIILDEKSGQPLEGVSVSVGSHQTSTTATGYFSLDIDNAPQNGGIKLRYSKDGHIPETHRYYGFPKNDIEESLQKQN